MDIGDTDINFDRLDEIVEKYQSRGYKVWTNRIGKKQNIELIFTNNI